jgi:hypothetical protein
MNQLILTIMKLTGIGSKLISSNQKENQTKYNKSGCMDEKI